MKALSFKEPWLNTYVERMLGLSASTKKAIIRVLERSLESKRKPQKDLSDRFWRACGAWESDETAEELMKSIRS